MLLWHLSGQQSKDQEREDARVKAQQDADAAQLLKAAQEKQVVRCTPTQTNERVTVLYATQPVEPGVRISPAFYEKKLTPVDILPDAYYGQGRYYRMGCGAPH